ncbi:MAG TPA: recombination mediator RecR [Patescibacteria group bacterium]|jgi:recombination protein RecR|nr:recombination mediator RecR [Patescibacteria group bacterium]
MTIPKAIQNLIESFEKLPGIGPKTAQRLTFYLLHVPQGELDEFASSVQKLKNDTILCSVCNMIDDVDPCSICSDPQRDQSILCVVEQPLDVLALEKGRGYKGVYFVLHGKIDPLNNIGPDEIFISQLLARIKDKESKVREIILATNPTMEGEATAMYIAKQLKFQNSNLKITRIGRGLPVGADLEYADDTTLQRAMEGRSQY